MTDYQLSDLEEAIGCLSNAATLLEDLLDMIDYVGDKIRDGRDEQERRWAEERQQAEIDYRMAVGI
ncbi:MAG: hypothetical protein FWG40_01210 [Peptococcaceae bacterium]|nr:hypothetical protein [Peptococcaceae bacterium]